MSRVVSKNLFNFQHAGVINEDILQAEALAMKDPEAAKGMEAFMKMMEMAKDHDANNKNSQEANEEYVKFMRPALDGMMTAMRNHPVLTEAIQECIESKIIVPTNHDGTYDVEVEVYTPKKIHGNKNNAAYVYAHGGGAVAFAASDFKGLLAHLAVECDVVVFNVDYRLAPETKCPNNVKDFYAAIKYVVKNASSLGVDPTKIAIAGHSGGGYICFGAMVMMAQKDETELVKLAMPGIPMVSDYAFSDPLGMTKEERDTCYMMRKVWRMIAADMEKQKDDPLLFPAKASDELLAKMPPTIVNEVEFDMFITEATRMANRLRAAGRLLELIVIPGCKHGSDMNPDQKAFKVSRGAEKLALKEYLHN